MKFEWNIGKAALNIKNHGVSFEEAEEAFFDEFSLDLFDESHSSLDEERFQILGLTSKNVLLVVYTLREAETYRIISARKATNPETAAYWNERKKYE